MKERLKRERRNKQAPPRFRSSFYKISAYNSFDLSPTSPLRYDTARSRLPYHSSGFLRENSL